MNISELKSYAKSQLSALTCKKVSQEVVKQRQASCFGEQGVAPPCPYVSQSKSKIGMHICGGCGCGERKILETAIQLFPYLKCPLGKQGFSEK
jgi:hypothetical protein